MKNILIILFIVLAFTVNAQETAISRSTKLMKDSEPMMQALTKPTFKKMPTYKIERLKWDTAKFNKYKREQAIKKQRERNMNTWFYYPQPAIVIEKPIIIIR